ncbi:MAG: hypothetical protein A3A81_06970 [Omnitrophica bacterium RIFCSPLOWO2_01_FULL_45_10b]|nr:MAG: hypothetical protein A3A81_06970 [Omnitrophica bacterium RIFCSPLOWO2_01_FULL_45_10b]
MHSVQASFGRVGVFLGGKSHERAISLRSGMAVYQALKTAGVDAVTIDTANGFRSKLKRDPVDLVFLALHGIGGEDGTIQKILNRFKIPYVGSGPQASSLAFDKVKAKQIFHRNGIPTPRYAVITTKNWKRILKNWQTPYVIKPVQEGSSIGIFFVEKKQNPAKKVEAALKKYDRLLVEEKIDGREFTVGILGSEALPVIELRPKRKFYDYQAKYTKGMTEYLVPAPIPEKLTKSLQIMALKAHRALGLRDLSRVDFRTDARNHPFVLEVNSIPGFTETSLLPKAAAEIGLDFSGLCLKLLSMAQNGSKEK